MKINPKTSNYIELFIDGVLNEVTDDDQIDYIYENVDNLLNGGEFEKLDALLLAIPIEKLRLSSLISLLTCSRWGEACIKGYADFFFKVVQYTKNTLNEDSARIRGLFSGLEPK